jgi:hypothetical protein
MGARKSPASRGGADSWGSSLLLSAALFGLAHAGQGTKAMAGAALGAPLLGGGTETTAY